MVSRHSLEVLDTVSHDEEQYIRAWSLFPTMSWGPAHTWTTIICWLGLLPVSRLQTGLLDLTLLHVSWHVLNASDSHYRWACLVESGLMRCYERYYVPLSFSLLCTHSVTSPLSMDYDSSMTSSMTHL